VSLLHAWFSNSCFADFNIAIGFARPSYTVREDGENVFVCLDVDVVGLLTGVITVQIISVEVTAAGKTYNQCICYLYISCVSNDN